MAGTTPDVKQQGMEMIDIRTQRNLKKATTTSRGTPRQRALRGSAVDMRYEVLQELDLEALERMLAGKLKRMDEAARVQFEAELDSAQDRREALAEMLSRWGSG